MRKGLLMVVLLMAGLLAADLEAEYSTTDSFLASNIYLNHLSKQVIKWSVPNEPSLDYPPQVKLEFNLVVDQSKSFFDEPQYFDFFILSDSDYVCYVWAISSAKWQMPCDFLSNPFKTYLSKKSLEINVPLTELIPEKKGLFVVDNTPFPPTGSFSWFTITLFYSSKFSYSLERSLYFVILVFSISLIVILLGLVALACYVSSLFQRLQTLDSPHQSRAYRLKARKKKQDTSDEQFPLQAARQENLLIQRTHGIQTLSGPDPLLERSAPFFRKPNIKRSKRFT